MVYKLETPPHSVAIAIQRSPSSCRISSSGLCLKHELNTIYIDIYIYIDDEFCTQSKSQNASSLAPDKTYTVNVYIYIYTELMCCKSQLLSKCFGWYIYIDRYIYICDYQKRKTPPVELISRF